MPRTHVAWSSRRPAEGFYSSETHAPSRRPVRTFLPTGYEDRYPYPLVVFFHGHGGTEDQIIRLAPRLSRRNYISIGLRGPHEIETDAGRVGFTWSDESGPDEATDEYILDAVTLTMRRYNVHSERIYLAGVWEGAEVAYRMALASPEKFAGVISLNGVLPSPREGGPLLRLPEARKLRVMIAHGVANSVQLLSSAQRNHRVFYAAGMDVQFTTYPTNHKLHTDMLRDVNRWIMKHVADDDGM